MKSAMIQDSLYSPDSPAIFLPGRSREENRVAMLRGSLPASPWVRPSLGADLTHARHISVDIESRDPDLHEFGPGFVRGTASVIGVAVSTEDFCEYYPIAHEHERELNFPVEDVINWLGYQLKHNPNEKQAANALYDLEGLYFEGPGIREVSGQLFDPQVAEALIDEEAPEGYALDTLARKYLGKRKDERLLREAAQIYGFKPADIKKNLHKMSPRFVGPYAMEDARLNTEVLDKQKVILQAQDAEGDSLWQCFLNECRLIPLLLKMRVLGIRVDIDRAQQVADQMQRDIDKKQAVLNSAAGFKVDVWKAVALARMCDGLNIPYAMTNAKKPAPSFTKDFFTGHEHPMIKAAGEIRTLKKHRDTFVIGYVLEKHVKGRLHCQFHQLRASDQDEMTEEGGEAGAYGARSGRFSSSNPNLQNIPSRDPVYGPLIRSLFVPEVGCRWGQFDIAGQEPCWTVHDAYTLGLPGSAEAVAEYHRNPKFKFHKWTAEITGLDYKSAKETGLGVTYGMGKRKLGFKLGLLTLKQALDRSYEIPTEIWDRIDVVLATYHEGVPFIKPLFDRCVRAAEERGYIKTYWRRKAHFDLWEPARYGENGYQKALPREQAELHWPDTRLKRAYCYKALNRRVQGCAADQMKEAMLQLFEAGLVPALTVHDEVDFGDIDSDSKAKRIEEIIANCVKLVVPIRLDVVLVENWGQCD